MFIQCQSCHTTYKIDENKIPDKRSVVRCAKCSEPIPLNKEEQDELLKKTPKQLVECDQCGTQYSVPLSSIKKESTSVKCGKCGNHFTIHRMQNDLPLNKDLDSASSYEDEDIGLDNIDIPEESNIEVDDLFENMDSSSEYLDEDLDYEDESESLTSKSADEEYLESVSIDTDDVEELDEDLGIKEIADDQKYKIFLKPKSLKEEVADISSDEDWPDIHDDLDSPEIEDAEEDLDDFTDLNDISALPKEDSPKRKSKRQRKEEKRSGKRILLWILWLLIIVAVGVVGWLLLEFRSEGVYSPPQTETFGVESKIAILEPLNGRFIKNRTLAQRVFLLEGKLLNVYGPEVAVSQIEIEGFLYSKDSDKPITSRSFAGVTLSQEDLEGLTKDTIESLLSNQTGSDSDPTEYSSDDLIDFQVVFFNAPNPKSVNKLGAKIRRFSKRER